MSEYDLPEPGEEFPPLPHEGEDMEDNLPDHCTYCGSLVLPRDPSEVVGPGLLWCGRCNEEGEREPLG